MTTARAILLPAMVMIYAHRYDPSCRSWLLLLLLGVYKPGAGADESASAYKDDQSLGPLFDSQQHL